MEPSGGSVMVELGGSVVVVGATVVVGEVEVVVVEPVLGGASSSGVVSVEVLVEPSSGVLVEEEVDGASVGRGSSVPSDEVGSGAEVRSLVVSASGAGSGSPRPVERAITPSTTRAVPTLIQARGWSMCRR
jgi:hypothetical protein